MFGMMNDMIGNMVRTFNKVICTKDCGASAILSVVCCPIVCLFSAGCDQAVRVEKL